MIVGSTKEDLSLEKRVSITPDTAKSLINLGLDVSLESGYASHIGIQDKEYEKAKHLKTKTSRQINRSPHKPQRVPNDGPARKNVQQGIP